MCQFTHLQLCSSLNASWFIQKTHNRCHFRNALFERPETFVTVSETANTLDIAAARRENIPEYVTIRRQRPTTVEATTVQ